MKTSIIIIALILTSLVGCKKESKVTPEYKITYTIHSDRVPYCVFYSDDNGYHSDNVNTKEWSKDVTIKNYNYYMLKVKTCSNSSNPNISRKDSLYMSAKYAKDEVVFSGTYPDTCYLKEINLAVKEK